MNEQKMPDFGGPGGPGGPMGGPPKAGYTEKTYETDWILTESTQYPSGIVLKEGSLPAASEGKALLMTVDGVPTTIAPGTYPGKVVFTVYTLTNIPATQAELSCGDFRTALHIRDGQMLPTGLEAVAGNYTAAPGRLTQVDMTTKIDDLNGIIVDAATPREPYVIADSTFHCSGGGNSEGRGACIMAVGEANVKLQNVEFWNYGTLTAVMASGKSRVEVSGSVIYGARDFSAGKLCPWVLGINGSNRLTNAIDQAQVHYHDSIVVAQSWAALSTDAGRGVRLLGERLFSGIGRLEPYQASRKDEYTAVPTLGEKKYGFILGNSAIGECGYVNYADTGFHNSFRDVTFYSPDYIFILSTGKASIDVEGDSFCYSNRIGVLFHKNSGGTVSLRGGKWYARDTLFQVKSYSETDTSGCFCHCICDGTEIQVGENGVLYQLMTSDDVGLGKDSVFVVPEIESKLHTVAPLPETYMAQKRSGHMPWDDFPVYLEDGQEIAARGDLAEFLKAHPGAEPVMEEASNRIAPATFTLKNLATSGDVFNGVYQRIQILEVCLDHAALTGTISSAYTYHVDKDGSQAPAGTAYRKSGDADEHLGIGRMGNTPAPSINNPVHLCLKNGAVWTAVGTSYLDVLELDENSKIIGTVTVNGTAVSGAGRYRGQIVVTATA